MGEALHNLGIEWTALLAQGINFGILLLILWKFVYKPVLKMLDDRSQKIEESIKNTQLVEEKLATASEESSKIIENAKKEAEKIINDSKNSAKDISQKILDDAEVKSKKIISDASLVLEKEKEAIYQSVKGDVAGLVKSSLESIFKTDSLKVSDKLIDDAVNNFSK